MGADWTSARSAWRAALGRDGAVLDTDAGIAPYLCNVGGVVRGIACVLRPRTVEEVCAVVRVAGEYGAPVYPVSRGRNWGMGSRLPARDGCAVVDLSGLNRIREVNVPFHYAVVEAGVTQGQLYDHLREQGLPLWINVTGSSRDTSAVGNALDRGVGYFRPRGESLTAMEVVLGSGERVRLGFGHVEGAATSQLFRPGVGPSMDGLFAQSNFGIVTAAGVDLLPAPRAHAAFVARVAREEDLAVLLDRLVGLRRDEVFQTVVHVGNRERSRITLAPLLYDQFRAAGLDDAAARDAAERLLDRSGFGPWSAVGGLLGPPGHLRSARREIRRALRGVARVVFLTDPLVRTAAAAARLASALPYARRQGMLLEAVRPLYNLTRGVPTDAALKSVFWPVEGAYPPAESNPDASHAGLLYSLPVLPADGATASGALADAHARLRAAGFEPATTLNLMDPRAFECVMSIAFDRRDAAAVERAHAAMRSLQRRFVETGYPPYRLGIESMDLLVDPADRFWQLAAGLKRVFDPKGILAPGRYSLE